MISDAPNLNRLWADLVVEELVRSGVDFFFLAPGSRSTPLVTAVAANPRARHLVHIDERGTAYAAVGYARATGRPAAWITTSGTAVANGLPAVVEAATEGVPMLLLTADRPPELRRTGANQTVEQVGLFGDFVRWQFDLPAPTHELPAVALLTTVDQAVYRARRAPKGPVHLNLMFREPLAPVRRGDDFSGYLAGVERWLGSGRPYTRYANGQVYAGGEAVEQAIGGLLEARHGLIVVGKLDDTVHREAMLGVAEALGWPVLPDVGSQLRLGGDDPALVSYYDQILLHEGFAREHQPEAVLQMGGRVTSKRLLQFLERSRPTLYVSVRDEPSRLDPNHQVTHAVESDLSAFCDSLVSRVGEGRPTRSEWAEGWRVASERVHERIEVFIGRTDEISEPLVARMVSQELPAGHGLFVASSMPIRDLDMYADPGGPAVRIGANRGASGIDGTVASAVGFACGLSAPVTLLVGDLALLHDLNSLALLRSSPHPLVVVAVNNDGGGIFSFLPIAEHRDVFESFFGTPHGLDFRHAAALFGLRYERPETAGALREAYRSAVRSSEPVLIEVKTDRSANLAYHRDLQRWIVEGLEQPF